MVREVAMGEKRIKRSKELKFKVEGRTPDMAYAKGQREDVA